MKTITLGVIAHVDHGKTTLVDALLKQGGAFAAHELESSGELIMDSNAQERERGITITAKNCAIKHGDTKINILDTPGHADFSSEVERVLKVCDTVLLLVDAKEGPMPQTRFVLQKSLHLGIKPIVVVNKIDKPDQRHDDVVNEVFDLFVELGATDEQLDFPIVYAIARDGIAKKEFADESTDLIPLFDTVEKHAVPNVGSTEEPLQILIYSLAYDEYVGRIGIGRVVRGTLKSGVDVALCKRDGSITKGRPSKIYVYEGLGRREVTEAASGEVVSIAGFPDITIGETLADVAKPEPLPVIEIGEPTVSMVFSVNTSPLAGKEGKFVTTRQIRDRLNRELETNVGLRVEDAQGDSFKVSGRGELHLAVLIESMRREGFELSVARPTVIVKEEHGHKLEPMELAIVNVPDVYAGSVIEKLGKRRGEMKGMSNAEGYTRLEFEIPTRGLLGYLSEFIRDTRGEGTLDHIFLRYETWRGDIETRKNGVLISMENGKSVAYALFSLQERGDLFIGAGVELYEGMIIGENAKDDDLVVNPIKEKKLTNMRASGTDEAIRLIPPRAMSLEQAIEYVGDDELVEVTPKSIRLRKKFLTEAERRKQK